MRNSLLLLLFFIANCPLVFGQTTFSLKGKIIDAANHEQVVGATISLPEINKGTEAELNGSYLIKNISAGTYNIRCSYIGYESIDTTVSINASMTLNFSLRKKSTALSEVLVQGREDGRTDRYARRAEQRSDNLTNILSANAIQLSPDITVANVLQRVSGVSIERNSTGDGNYAIIRGMDKRYNYTLVNGVKIPSPDNRNRYVPMDIFPADLLDRLEVIKSLTPEMEGDASGGAINLVMKDAPDHLVFNVKAATGYSQLFFDRDYVKFNHQAINLKSPAEMNGTDYYAKISDFTTANLKYHQQQAPLNQIFGFTLGNRFLNHKLGALVAFSYQNTFRGANSTFFVPSTQPNPAPDINHDNSPSFTDGLFRQYSTQRRRMGAHLKMDYKINEHNSLSLYALDLQLNAMQYRHTVDTILAIQRVGPGEGLVELWDRSKYELQNIKNLTLQGKHDILHNMDVDWSAVYSAAKRQLPDLAQLKTTHQVGFDANGKQYATPPLLLNLKRDWQHNKDQDLAGYLNLHYYPQLFNRKFSISIGGLYRHKHRDNYDNEYPLSAQLTSDGKSQQFTTIDSAKFTFKPDNAALGSALSNPGVYTFDENIGAGYGEIKFLINDKWQLLAGVRLEHTYQQFGTSAPASFPGQHGTISYLDILPSGQLKYMLDSRQDVRLAYFKSICRPAYADVIPFPDASSNEYYTVDGNANLKHTQIQNLDLRYEIFPSGLDELMVGAFYKYIQNPIEYALRKTGNSSQELRPDNFGNATNFGLELEFIKYFGYFGVSGNYTYTHSRITSNKGLYYRDENNSLTTAFLPQSRPLQGQAANIGNLSLLYKNVSNGWSAQLAAVYTGERIEQLSLYRNLDYWQEPTTILDFSLQKTIGKFTIYGKANNLLNTPNEVIIKQPNHFRSGKLALPAQDSDQHILVQKDIYKPSYILGVRFKLNS